MIVFMWHLGSFFIYDFFPFMIILYYYILLLINPFDHVVMRFSLNLLSLCSKEFTNPGVSGIWKVSYFETDHRRVVIPPEVAASIPPGREKDADAKSGT